MRKTLYSIALIGTLALAGCQRSERMIDGKVYDKVYEPATTRVVVTPRNISKNMYAWEEEEVPERFVFRIEGEIDEKKHLTSINVDKDTFNDYQIGDKYPKPKLE